MFKKEYKQLVKKISEYKTIIIAKHILPDWDAQGSAIGLANIINDNFKNKNVYVVGSRIDDDNTFFIPEQQLSEEMVSESLLITVDTANTERIDFSQWNKAKEIFKVDHHIEIDVYGTYNLVDKNVIACTQIITLWAATMKLKISKDAAKNLYLGLITDSNRFLFEKTDDRTFEAAKILVNTGINIQEIYDYLYIGDLKIRKWTNFAFRKMKLSKAGVASIVITEKDYSNLDLSYEELKSALGTMAGIKEIKIWMTIIEWEGKFKVSLRSRSYDVNSIAVKYNGGGHKLASGAKLESIGQKQQLIKDLDNLIIREEK